MTPMEPMDAGQIADSNIRRFVLFRVLFNARFYYPVLAILFLDLGLSMEEYTLLNAAWAASIVLFEVPSGAMADRFGRRRMVVFAAGLMVVEMALLAFASAEHHLLLLGAVLLNRILSGIAEASASGADEALAYDSLAAEGRASEWPAVLDRLMRWQSIGFVASSILGAAVYDAALLNRFFAFAGLPTALISSETVRFPLYLTLLTSIAALAATLGMRECVPTHSLAADTPPTTRELIRSSARWILLRPFILSLILVGIAYDSIIRLFLTVASNYYRLIELPVALYGIIGSAFAVVGFLIPPLARKLATQYRPTIGFGVVGILILTGLIGVALLIPRIGVIFLVPLAMAMFLLNYQLSHHLNAHAEPSMRATILSFKGLAMNLAYGTIGILFAALVAFQKGRLSDHDAQAAFAAALRWLPWYFLALLLLLTLRRKSLREAPRVISPTLDR